MDKCSRYYNYITDVYFMSFRNIEMILLSLSDDNEKIYRVVKTNGCISVPNLRILYNIYVCVYVRFSATRLMNSGTSGIRYNVHNIHCCRCVQLAASLHRRRGPRLDFGKGFVGRAVQLFTESLSIARRKKR